MKDDELEGGWGGSNGLPLSLADTLDNSCRSRPVSFVAANKHEKLNIISQWNKEANATEQITSFCS